MTAWPWSVLHYLHRSQFVRSILGMRAYDRKLINFNHSNPSGPIARSKTCKVCAVT